MTTSALERVIRRASIRRVAVGERCQLCDEPIPDVHRHMLDTDADGLLCVCQACSILFNRDAASNGHYRLLPERRLSLPGLDTGVLGVPVGLAYFVKTNDGGVEAHYPSPMGATKWEIDPPAWETVEATHPELHDLQPRVEALLVNTVGDRRDVWIVPIDDCYRLVAIVRQEWKGLSGGSRVWPEIEGFFDELRRTHGPNPRR